MPATALHTSAIQNKQQLGWLRGFCHSTNQERGNSMIKSLRRLLATTYGEHRGLFGKFAFELVVVFIGVTAAFAIENWRQEAEEARYRSTVVVAVGQTFGSVATHGRGISRAISDKLRVFDDGVARGDQPKLPVYREPGGEGPPTQIWDGLMSTGALKALKPDMVWRLAAFYNELNSVGDRYLRYNAVTETLVFGLDPDQAEAWVDGRLKPEFRAYVEQLRELRAANDSVIRKADRLRRDIELDNAKH